MLNGLIKPDTGRIEIHGQVGALIALGAGFNPILTARENIYINASVLGLSKKLVDERIDEIIAFAEIEDFIDMPVQHFSSGMTVRLGFAVAAILIEPDILFLDEVLAVGDISFTIKCLNRVRELMRTSAVVFVSHNMPLITSFCTRVLVMDHGRLGAGHRGTGDGGEPLLRAGQEHRYRSPAQVGLRCWGLRYPWVVRTWWRRCLPCCKGWSARSRSRVKIEAEHTAELWVVIAGCTIDGCYQHSGHG